MFQRGKIDLFVVLITSFLVLVFFILFITVCVLVANSHSNEEANNLAGKGLPGIPVPLLIVAIILIIGYTL